MSIFKAILNSLMGDDEYENGNDSLSKPKREHKHSDMEDFESIEDTNEDNFEDKDDNEFEDEDEDDVKEFGRAQITNSLKNSKIVECPQFTE